MPLSKAQLVEKNKRRLTEIIGELEGLAAKQTQATTPEEQVELLHSKETLEKERTAIQSANDVLRAQIEQAVREQAESNKRIWLEQERFAAEKARNVACAKVMAKIRSLKKEYDKLVEVEKRWTQQWNERGRPRYLNQDRPFVTSARRDIYSFLGLDKRPRMSQTSDQKRVAEILGPTAQVGLIISSEKRRAARKKAKEDESAAKIADEKRAARKKELIAGVEELRAEASPPQGTQVEESESVEKTINGPNE